MTNKIVELKTRLCNKFKADIKIYNYYDGYLNEEYWLFLINFLKNDVSVRITIYESILCHYTIGELYDIMIARIEAEILSHFIK